MRKQSDPPAQSSSLSQALVRLAVVAFALLAYAADAGQGDFRWAKAFESVSNFAQSRSIEVDAEGAAYSIGNFSGAFDSDPGPDSFILNAGEKWHTFVTKLNAAGDFVWAKQIGGANTNEHMLAMASTFDPFGNLYVTGSFSGTVDFDPGPDVANLVSTAYPSAFILKLTADGEFIWTKQFGGRSQCDAITTDVSGNIYLTGHLWDDVDFDPGVGVATLSSPGNFDAFVCKLDLNGQYIWARQLGNVDTDDDGHSITVDASENVYFAGQFNGPLVWKKGATEAGKAGTGASAFLAKLDQTGNYVWTRQTAAFTNIRTANVVLDQDGNVFLSTHFSDTADFAPGAATLLLTSNGSRDIALSKFDSAGTHLWTKQIGGTGTEHASELSVDRHGDIYLAGSYQGTADFDPGPGVVDRVSSYSGGFVLKLNNNGEYQFVRDVSGFGYVSYNSIEVTPDGGIYVAASLRDGSADFDSGNDIYYVNGFQTTPVIVKLGNFYPAVNGISINFPHSSIENVLDFEVAFDRAVTGVDVTDFALTSSGVTGAAITSVSGDTGSTRKVTVNTGREEGTIQLHVVDDNTIVDATVGPLGGTRMGDGNFSAAPYTVDRVLPSVELSSNSPEIVNKDYVSVHATFNENVFGFDTSDIETHNCTASLSGINGHYALSVTPIAQGPFTLTIPASVCRDIAGNPNTASVVFRRIYDSVGPKPTLTRISPQYVNGPAEIGVTFDEPFTDFDSEMIRLTNATLIDVQGSETTYTFTLIGLVDGPISVSMAPGAAYDLAGNKSQWSNIVTLHWDTAAPVITLYGSSTMQVGLNTSFVDPGARAVDAVNGVVPVVTSGSVNTAVSGTYEITYEASDQLGNHAHLVRTVIVLGPQYRPVISSVAPDPTNSSPIMVTVEFDRDVLGFDLGDAVVTNGSISHFGGIGASFSFRVTPFNDGVVTVDIAAGSCTDLFGNVNDAADQFRRTFDTTGPGAIVSNIGIGATNSNPLAFNVTFEDAVTGFDQFDPVVVNGSVTSVSGSGATYTVLVAPASAGPVTLSVPANVAADVLGNFSKASNTATRYFDNVPPVVWLAGHGIVYLEQFEVFIDEGAKASDNFDGDLTSQIVTQGGVTSSVLGYYQLLYSVTDSAGNSSIPVTRGVVVTEAGKSLPIDVRLAVVVLILAGWAVISRAHRRGF